MKTFDLTGHIYAQIGRDIIYPVPCNDSQKSHHIIDMTIGYEREIIELGDEQAIECARQMGKWFKTPTVFTRENIVKARRMDIKAVD